MAPSSRNRPVPSEGDQVTVFWVVLGIGVLAVVAVVAAGRGGGLDPAEPDRPDVALPVDRLVSRPDVDAVRFSVGLRGYRMDEVDDVLDRIAADLESRDARIRQLELELQSRPRYPGELPYAAQYPSELTRPTDESQPRDPARPGESTGAAGPIGPQHRAEVPPGTQHVLEGAGPLVTPARADVPDATTARVLVVPIEPSNEPPAEPVEQAGPPDSSRGEPGE
jgi:DivIVA domain-containing protein